MKLVRFDNWSTGILVEGADPAVVDVGASLERLSRLDGLWSSRLRPFFDRTAGPDWRDLIVWWDDIRGPLGELHERARAAKGDVVVHPLASLALNPPLVMKRARIFALGANFADHTAGAETVRQGRTVTEQDIRNDKASGLPPWGFTIVPETVVSSGDAVTPPPGTQKLDYEAEVAVVLASGGRSLDPAAVRIWGFTAWNDLSLRDPHFKLGPRIDRGPLVWALQKNFDTGNAAGPWLTVDEPHDLSSLAIKCRVNGELRQNGSTSQMVYSFAEAASHLSAYFPMQIGDMIVSGTPKGTAFESGVNGPYLRDGDRIEVEVEGVGILRNHVVMRDAPSGRG